MTSQAQLAHPFERSLVAHLIADRLLQNDWAASFNGSLLHPAARVHGGIYAVFIGLALSSWQGGLVLRLVHVRLDTRQPLIWWRTDYRQTTTSPAALQVAIWSDQALHIAALALWIALIPEEGAS